MFTLIAIALVILFVLSLPNWLGRLIFKAAAIVIGIVGVIILCIELVKVLFIPVLVVVSFYLIAKYLFAPTPVREEVKLRIIKN